MATFDSRSQNLKELDTQVKSMIEKASDGGSGVRAQFKCKTCGKIAESPQMRNHIESLHLEGVSLPCELCEKVTRGIRVFPGHFSAILCYFRA